MANAVYHLIRAKRFLFLTITIFFFQFLINSKLSISSSMPLYLPMGIAFSLFYLFGNNAVLGILLGEACAYFIKGYPTELILVYLIADIGCGYLGALLCQNIFSSDIVRFTTWRECCKFVMINAFITCIISSSIRFIAIKKNFLNLWLADLNSILIFSGFLIPWLSIPFSREKISHQNLNKLTLVLFGVMSFLSIVFLKKPEFIIIFALALLLAIYLSYCYGYFIATASLFVVAIIYSAYFLAHQYQWMQYNAIALLLFTIGMLCLGYRSKDANRL